MKNRSMCTCMNRENMAQCVCMELQTTTTLHEQGLVQLSKPCSSFLSQLMIVLNTFDQHQLNSHMYLKSHAENSTCTHMYMYRVCVYLLRCRERERERLKITH